MIFQNKNNNIQTLTLKIDNIDIEQVMYFNFLGLIIDTNLNWKKHIEKYQMHLQFFWNFKHIETCYD